MSRFLLLLVLCTSTALGNTNTSNNISLSQGGEKQGITLPDLLSTFSFEGYTPQNVVTGCQGTKYVDGSIKTEFYIIDATGNKKIVTPGASIQVAFPSPMFNNLGLTSSSVHYNDMCFPRQCGVKSCGYVVGPMSNFGSSQMQASSFSSNHVPPPNLISSEGKNQTTEPAIDRSSIYFRGDNEAENLRADAFRKYQGRKPSGKGNMGGPLGISQFPGFGLPSAQSIASGIPPPTLTEAGGQVSAAAMSNVIAATGSASGSGGNDPDPFSKPPSVPRPPTPPTPPTPPGIHHPPSIPPVTPLAPGIPSIMIPHPHPPPPGPSKPPPSTPPSASPPPSPPPSATPPPSPPQSCPPLPLPGCQIPLSGSLCPVPPPTPSGCLTPPPAPGCPSPPATPRPTPSACQVPPTIPPPPLGCQNPPTAQPSPGCQAPPTSSPPPDCQSPPATPPPPSGCPSPPTAPPPPPPPACQVPPSTSSPPPGCQSPPTAPPPPSGCPAPPTAPPPPPPSCQVPPPPPSNPPGFPPAPCTYSPLPPTTGYQTPSGPSQPHPPCPSSGPSCIHCKRASLNVIPEDLTATEQIITAELPILTHDSLPHAHEHHHSGSRHRQQQQQQQQPQSPIDPAQFYASIPGAIRGHPGIVYYPSCERSAFRQIAIVPYCEMRTGRSLALGDSFDPGSVNYAAIFNNNNNNVKEEEKMSPEMAQEESEDSFDLGSVNYAAIYSGINNHVKEEDEQSLEMAQEEAEPQITNDTNSNDNI